MYYFNFITPISRHRLEDLAQGAVAADSVQSISKLFDQYTDFISLENDLFVLRHQNSDAISYEGERSRGKEAFVSISWGCLRLVFHNRYSCNACGFRFNAFFKKYFVIEPLVFRKERVFITLTEFISSLFISFFPWSNFYQQLSKLVAEWDNEIGAFLFGL